MNSSPFHADEREAQARAGQVAKGSGIRNFMPDQHRSFFALLPYLFVAGTDANGWPLATILSGQEGFVHSPDPVTLRVDALPQPLDPAAEIFAAGKDIGVLGLDLSTRRRNRANGHIAVLDTAGFAVAVDQSFGNCAKYIQRRAVHQARRASPRVEAFSDLDADTRAQIVRADTFFIASRSRAGLLTAGGIDMSHRGGQPGFVRVDADTLTIPDFPGNRYFNTLGNLLGDPRCALLFIDFETGNLLQLQGKATINWNAQEASVIDGAERLWRFDVVRGWRHRAACALTWSFIDYSPTTLATGSWEPSVTGTSGFADARP